MSNECTFRVFGVISRRTRDAPRSGRAFRTEGGGNAAPGPARDPAMARLSRAALVALVVLTSLVAEVRGARTRALSSPSKKRRSPPRLLPPRSVADSPAPVHPARSSPGRAPRVERDAPRAAPRRLGPDVARARGRRLAPEPSTPSSSRGGDAVNCRITGKRHTTTGTEFVSGNHQDDEGGSGAFQTNVQFAFRCVDEDDRDAWCFFIALQEPTCLDQWHKPETVSWMAMEEGSWLSDDGKQIQVGHATVGSTGWTWVP